MIKGLLCFFAAFFLSAGGSEEYSLYYAKFPSRDKPWMCPNCDYVNDKNAVTCDGCNWDPRIDPVPYR